MVKVGCGERLYFTCHRCHVREVLKKGFRVIHIIEEGWLREDKKNKIEAIA